MNIYEIEAQPENRMKEIAIFTKKNQCNKILDDHLNRFIKTNKIGGDFTECNVSEDLFFDKIYPKKNPTRFINSDKFKGRINKDKMIDISIAVTKNNDDEYEKLFWYTLLNIPKEIKASNLCVKGTIKFKDGENDDLFDRFQECVVTKIDKISQATDSDEESSQGPKVYESFIKGKVKKYSKKTNEKKNKSQSDNEFDNVPDSGSVSEAADEEKSISGGASKKNSAENTPVVSSSDEEDDEDEEPVEEFNPFKNKTVFQNYLRENNLRSKKVFRATVENLDKDIQEEFEVITKTIDFVNKFFELKILPKKE